MQEAPIPPNEEGRLWILRLYRVLDTAAEKSFDDLTQLAAAICQCPISLISLVDEKRQWFKSRVGLEVSETPRAVAFCAHAIHQPDLFVVENTLEDERFIDNPLVQSEPFIRFYAGAPLNVHAGEALGTLCVIDTKPRKLTPFQENALKVLRHAVVTQLELRRALDDLRVAEQMLKMCAWCRNVKDSEGNWRGLDRYVMSTVEVTHGLCPECSVKAKKALEQAP